MHQAFSWSEPITFTSQFQPAASGRNTFAWGIRRLAIARTRSVWAGSRLSTPFCRAWVVTWAYCFAADALTSFDDTSIACWRSTPTAPDSVVLTVAQPATAIAATAMASALRNVADMGLHSGARTITRPRPTLLTSKHGVTTWRPARAGSSRARPRR